MRHPPAEILMKRKIQFALVLFLLKMTALPQLSTCLAQGTAFTYQGRLSVGGSTTNGLYDFTFTLFGTNSGGSAIAGPVTNSAVGVTNGLFTTTIDFGAAFPGAYQWLEIAARSNLAGPFTTLAPRQALTPVPYAVFAEGASASGISGTVPSRNLGGNYTNAVTFNNGANSFNGTFYGAFYGSDFIGGDFVGSFIGDGSSLGGVWHTGGNYGTTPGVNFVGTADNQPLELRANSQRALRLEPNSAGAPNVIGGASVNVVSAGIVGATIGGGGAVNYSGASPNNVSAIFGTIGGGRNNSVAADHGAIGGGHDNYIGAAAYDSVIAGGSSDSIAATATGSAIGGGNNNTVAGDHGFIGAGHNNQIGAGAYDSVIAGGASQTIVANATGSAIGGGYFNSIGASSSSVAIAGGYQNTIGTNSPYSSIAGGLVNSIYDNVYYSTIGGGWANFIQINSAGSTIAGGLSNGIGTNAIDASVGGGDGNQIQGGANYATISGGFLNTIGAAEAVIGGGQYGTIGAGSSYAVIAGGSSQTIQSNSLGSAILGGEHNTILANTLEAAIGGGAENYIASYGSVVSGGYSNSIQPNAFCATVSGGSFNSVGTNAANATIAGGLSNSVAGSYALAAGRRAKANHNGTFVWADSQDADFATAASNQFLIRAGGGLGIGTATTPPGGLRVHTGGLAVTGASSPNYGTNAGVYIEWGATQGNVFAFDYGPFLPRPLVLNSPGGNVGIGRTPTANALEVEGNASKTVAGSWAANSDARIKQDIKTLSGALATLERVRLVSFRYSENYRREHSSVGDRRYVNVVAQEFRDVFPNDVKSSGEKLPDGSDEILQVDTYPLIIYSAAAIQELNEQLKGKEAKIAELEQRLEKVERLVTSNNAGAK
ncbi:MAG: hypothetical protein C5B50_05115 [Verrucomicrobia bacterium]|nr:MAG: hypothetical protein C5B50_05115 [Verrucomicrobiota bacterium]